MNLGYEDKNILIVGLGLMGASFADAIRSLNPKGIFGYDISKETLEHAKSVSLINDGYYREEDIDFSKMDVVLVCLYVDDAINFIINNMHRFKSGTIITDIVGVKSKIVSSVRKVLRDDIEYIPGHPMAGRERKGYFYADKEIFYGRNYILTPISDKKAPLDFIKRLIKDIGFKKIVITDPKTHDEKIAFTSQLCHIIALSLVDINEDKNIVDFGGGSYEDMTRIAMINSTMWSELFIENKQPLIDILDKFKNSIEQFEDLIRREDPSLKSKLDEINKKREIL